MGELEDALAAGQPNPDDAEDALFEAQPEVIAFEHSSDGRTLSYVAGSLVDDLVAAALAGNMQAVVAIKTRIEEQA